MSPLDRSLISESKKILSNLEKAYPFSRAGIVISHTENLIVNEGQTDTIFYMASLSKPAWIATGLALAEKSSISLDDQVFIVDDDLHAQIKDEVRALTKEETVIPDTLTLRDIVGWVLGLSANTPLLALKHWIEQQVPISAADYVQQQTEAILKEVTGKNDLVWTITGSAKAVENNRGNTGTLEEVFAFFELIANEDTRLCLSPTSFEVMKNVMRGTIQPLIQLTGRLKGQPNIKDVLGKFGYWSSEKKEDIALLTSTEETNEIAEVTVFGSTERVVLQNGETYDVGYYAAIPHTETEDREEFKKTATDIVAGGIAELFTD
jgi:hypothetical protein